MPYSSPTRNSEYDGDKTKKNNKKMRNKDKENHKSFYMIVSVVMIVVILILIVFLIIDNHYHCHEYNQDNNQSQFGKKRSESSTNNGKIHHHHHHHHHHYYDGGDKEKSDNDMKKKDIFSFSKQKSNESMLSTKAWINQQWSNFIFLANDEFKKKNNPQMHIYVLLGDLSSSMKKTMNKNLEIISTDFNNNRDQSPPNNKQLNRAVFSLKELLILLHEIFLLVDDNNDEAKSPFLIKIHITHFYQSHLRKIDHENHSFHDNKDWNIIEKHIDILNQCKKYHNNNKDDDDYTSSEISTEDYLVLYQLIDNNITWKENQMILSYIKDELLFDDIVSVGINDVIYHQFDHEDMCSSPKWLVMLLDSMNFLFPLEESKTKLQKEDIEMLNSQHFCKEVLSSKNNFHECLENFFDDFTIYEKL